MVGSTFNSYDNALAEIMSGLYKAKVINRVGPCQTVKAVELATRERVAWFNPRRLLEPIGYIPPAVKLRHTTIVNFTSRQYSSD
jgi:putative transposase